MEKQLKFETTAKEFSLVGLGVSVMGALLSRGPDGSISLREILSADTDDPKYCANLSGELTQLEAKLAQAMLDAVAGTPYQSIMEPGFKRMVARGQNNVN